MAFNLPSKNTYIQKKPVVQPPTYTRPLDWIAILAPPANEVFYLVSDISPIYTISTTFTRLASQNIYIDWGDGVIDTVSSLSTSTAHTYTVGGGTACSRGYTTWKIRIYADPGATITLTKFIQTVNYTQLPIGLLEAHHGDGTLSTANSLFTPTTVLAPYLEYFKCPSTMSAAGALFFESFMSCGSLQIVIMPTSAANNTSFSSTFSRCSRLQSIVLPSDSILVTTYLNTFQFCYKLQNITLPTSMNFVTTMAATFQLTQIQSITLPPLPACLSYATTFTQCAYLTSVRFTSFTPTAQSITFQGTFNACYSLQDMVFPPFANNTILTLTTTFANCASLAYITIPDNILVSSAGLNTTFGGCSKLLNVRLPTSMPAVPTFPNTFQNCYSLQSITLPTTVSSSISLVGTFSSCISLSEIVIPESYNITSLNSTFIGCTTAHTITLPSGSQDANTSLFSTFSNCNSLVNLTMPSTMISCSTIATAFNGCTTLQSVTLPPIMNFVTTAQTTFASATNLQSVTMPVSMSACTNFLSTFQLCASLKAVTMPAVTSPLVTTYATCFQNCYSINSITLPTTQTTALASMNAMFASCYLIKTIDNFDKLGNTSALVGNVTYIDGSFLLGFSPLFTTSITTPTKWSRFTINGSSATLRNSITSIRLTNTGAGQWGGASPQINISYTNLDTAAINLLFADMAAMPNVTSKTIVITGATGAAGLSAANRLVVTNKGWTITG